MLFLVPALKQIAKAAKGLIQKWLFRDETPPFVMEFSISDTFDPSTIDFNEYKALLHVMKGERAGMWFLETVWETKKAFDEARSGFVAKYFPLGTLEKERLATGPDSPRWRVDWAKVILTVIAAVPTIFSWVSNKLVAADVRPIPDKRPVDALVDILFSVECEVVNAHPTASCDLDFEVPEFRLGGKPVANGVDTSILLSRSFPNLKGEKRFAIPGKISQPGLYELHLKGNAEAGAWRVKKEVVVSRLVRVWSPQEVPTERTVTKGDQDRYNVECTLLVGREAPEGLQIQAVLDKVKGVRLRGAGFSDTPRVESDFNPDLQFPSSYVEWRTPRGLKAFQSYPFTLSLQELNQDPKDWTTIANQIEFRFQTLNRKPD